MKLFNKIKRFVISVIKAHTTNSILSEMASINATMLSIFFAFVSALLIYESQKVESLNDKLDDLRNKISETIGHHNVFIEWKHRHEYTIKDSVNILKISEVFEDIPDISRFPETDEDYNKVINELGERFLVLINYVARYYPYYGNDGGQQKWRRYDDRWAKDVEYLNFYLSVRDEDKTKILRIIEAYDKVKNSELSDWSKKQGISFHFSPDVDDFFQKNKDVGNLVKEVIGTKSKLESIQNDLKIKNHIFYYFTIFILILSLGIFIPLVLFSTRFKDAKLLNWTIMVFSFFMYICLIYKLLL